MQNVDPERNYRRYKYYYNSRSTVRVVQILTKNWKIYSAVLLSML